MGRKRVSAAWEYFTSNDVTKEGKKTANCNICSKCVVFNGNTTNLLSHLRIHHQDEYAAMSEYLQPQSKRQKRDGENACEDSSLNNSNNSFESSGHSSPPSNNGKFYQFL